MIGVHGDDGVLLDGTAKSRYGEIREIDSSFITAVDHVRRARQRADEQLLAGMRCGDGDREKTCLARFSMFVSSRLCLGIFRCGTDFGRKPCHFESRCDKLLTPTTTGTAIIDEVWL